MSTGLHLIPRRLPARPRPPTLRHPLPSYAYHTPSKVPRRGDHSSEDVTNPSPAIFLPPLPPLDEDEDTAPVNDLITFSDDGDSPVDASGKQEGILKARISELEAEVRELKGLVRDVARSPQMLTIPPPIISSDLLTLALGHLCGTSPHHGAVFTSALLNLFILTSQANTPLPSYTLPSPSTQQSIISTFLPVIDVLLFRYDNTIPINLDPKDTIRSFTPPDILWIFIHSADICLLSPFHDAIVLYLERHKCWHTQRGVMLRLMRDKMRPEDVFARGLDGEGRMRLRRCAEGKGWYIPPGGLNGLRRIGWAEVHRVVKREVRDKKRRWQEDDDSRHEVTGTAPSVRKIRKIA